MDPCIVLEAYGRNTGALFIWRAMVSYQSTYVCWNEALILKPCSGIPKQTAVPMAYRPEIRQREGWETVCILAVNVKTQLPLLK